MKLFGGLCDLGWLPESSPPSRDPHRKTGKGMRTCPELGAPSKPPTPWRHHMKAQPHNPRASSKATAAVSAAHTAPPFWLQEPKIHRKATVGQEESKFKSQSQGTCLLTASPASAGIAGNITVSKAGEKAQQDYIHLQK